MSSVEQGVFPTADSIFLVGLKLKNTEFFIPRQNILTVELRESVIQLVPTLKVTMNDKGNFTENFPITDSDVIELTIAPTKEANPITMDFIVSEFTIVPKMQGKSSVYVLSAYLSIPMLFTPDILDAKRGNSLQVLTEVAREVGMSVVNDSSIEPADNMVWYRQGCVFEYMAHILANSFVPDDTAFFYADHSSKFHFNTYKSAANAKPKFVAKYDIDGTQKFVLEDDEKNIMYYKNFDIVSINGTVKNECGYGVMCFAYDGKGSTHETIDDTFKKT